MPAPAIPPIRLGLIGTGLAVEKPHWPALRRPADRYVLTAFTDRTAEQSRRFGARPVGSVARSISSSASFAA